VAPSRSLLERSATALLFLAACRDPSAATPGSPAPSSGSSTPPGHVASALPALSVRTERGEQVLSKEQYLRAEFSLADTTRTAIPPGTLEIRGRGNSTWAIMPKKPYRLRLASARAILGMSSSRHWVLLANYADKTLLRNDVAFALSRRMAMAYTPRAEFVDLTLNGRYEGVYQIAEHVRVAPDRVNVPELRASDTAAAAITGGYLLEIDELRGEPYCFESRPTPMVLCAKSPEPEDLLTPAWAPHRAYIEGYVRRADSVLHSPGFADPATGYAAYLDVASAVDYYLLNELLKNVDANLRRSTFLYKPRGGKLAFGPVWDYDLAMGNVDYSDAASPVGWYVRRAPWYARLLADPAFDARVRARWRALRDDGTLAWLVGHVWERAHALSRVQARNFERWPILGYYVWPNRVVTGSYEGEVRAMQEWLAARIAWMDAELGR
jgi:hypothetical protein